MGKIDVSIIFVYYNTPSEIVKAVKSVKNAISKYTYEIILIDNDSQIPPPYNLISEYKIKYKKNRNLGYGLGLNTGVKLSRGKFLVFTNSDLIFQKNALTFMIEKLKSNKELGIIGPAFLDEKNKIRKVGNDFPSILNSLFALSSINNLFPNNYFSNRYFMKKFDRKSEREIPVLCGACMITKKEVFKKIKGFDKRFFMYFEEADICKRISDIGLKVLYFPKSRVNHFVGKSTSNEKWIEETFEHSRFEFLKKYYGFVGVFTEIMIRITNLPAKLI